MSTRKELVRDKIEAVARLWYASEPDKGLRERLTEGLIDKMTAAVLPALAEASQRSETPAPRDTQTTPPPSEGRK